MKFFNKIKLNIPVRMRHWVFWLGLGGTILAAMDVSPEMFTTWGLLWQEFINLLSNPFRLGCVVIAIMGVMVDPTTAGFGDSSLAMSYKSPNKE